MEKTFKFEDFQAQVNQDFQVEQVSGKWITVTLIEASELPYQYPQADKGQGSAFSLVFRAGSDVNLSDKIYNVKNSELDESQIFLVQLQPDEQGSYYEAVFS